MNIFKNSASVLTACLLTAGMVAVAPEAAKAQSAEYETFSLSPGFLPDPQVGRGYSGGSLSSDCGYINSNRPDHILYVNNGFSFLRASVQAEGDVTLLVDGPDGRYCSDDVNGLMPEISGSWPAGTYYMWVGDFVGDPTGAHRYELYLSEF